jgi:hypothetical protein
MSMFEQASRLKVRYNYKGLCTVEDLWDAPLTSLDIIFKGLNAQMKAQKEESLLETRSKEDELLALKIGIVKHIVEVRVAEQKAHADKVATAEKKQKLLGLIAEKQDESLRSMTVEELTNLVNSL